MDDHLSRVVVAGDLERCLPCRNLRATVLAECFGSLQQTGFTSRTGHPDWLCALTALVSPLPAEAGGIVSVALSLGSPPVAVNNRPALRCPDFPLPRSRGAAIISRSDKGIIP